MATTAQINSSLLDELDQDFAASDSEHEDLNGGDNGDGLNLLGNDGDSGRQDADRAASKVPLTDKRWQELEDILGRIELYQTQAPKANTAGLDKDPQYQLLEQANAFSTNIDDHTQELLKRLRDIYSARFPELETLLPDPLEYTKAAAIIGNGPMDDLEKKSESSDNIVHLPLSAVLSRPKRMTILVEATTTQGSPLSEPHLAMVESCCSKLLRLETGKGAIQSFVESRMNLFAPNMTMLVGPRTAAQIITARGGLKGLAETRSANLAAVGSKRFAASGMATNTGVRNQGYLYNSELLQRFRPDLRVQGMRILSGKVVLAARMDLQQSSPDGAQGAAFLEHVEKSMDKLTRAAPNKGQRALPAPDDKPSKKRGGRAARMAKAATAQTDLRKAQNRMRFGEQEDEVGFGTGDSTAGLGMIGQKEDGRIRAMQVDKRTRAKLSKKKQQGWAAGDATAANTLNARGPSGAASSHGLRTSGVSTSLGTKTAGTASSLAFGDRQGLELVDPKVKAEMERKERAEADRWFKGGTFTQISQATMGSDGFKKPGLPLKRKADDQST